MAEDEEWRPVAGHEHRYEVSSKGRVRAFDRWVDMPASRRHLQPWRMLISGGLKKLTLANNGYLVTSIAGAPRPVHRLMLEAFAGPCPEGHESLHDDDVKTNNSFPNLRWGTRAQNVLDAYRNGRKAPTQGPRA